MKKHILIIILAFGTSGCATQPKQGGLSYQAAQEWKLSQAEALLQEGNTSAAVQVLVQICADPVAPGVTDEALFRLSLLHLGSGRESSGIVQTRNDLELLAKTYTFSPWAPLASRLTDFLASTDETLKYNSKLKKLNLSLTHENSKLKELNLSLVKENYELRKRIERLKSLELELGRGAQR